MAKTKDHLTTGETARYLTAKLGDSRPSGGFSLQAVRRLIAKGELSFVWSRDEVGHDVRGFAMRGHRRILRASAEAYVKREQKRLADAAELRRQAESLTSS
jgi:hypothetical protein